MQESVGKCDLDIRRDLYNGIILTGARLRGAGSMALQRVKDTWTKLAGQKPFDSWWCDHGARNCAQGGRRCSRACGSGWSVSCWAWPRRPPRSRSRRP